MAYTLKGKKCGKVRFVPLKSGVVEKESESYSSTVTSNPIEKGSEINDHVNNSSGALSIAGTLVGGSKEKKDLLKMRNERDIIKYTGKTQMKNLVFTSLKFDSTSKNKKGYTFSASLKQIQITAPKKKKKKKKMSDQDSGKSKKKKLKKTKNKGHTAKASISVSSSGKKKLQKAKKSKTSKAPLTRKTKGYSGA